MNNRNIFQVVLNKFTFTFPCHWGFPASSDGKESSFNAGDPGLILGWEDPLEKGMATSSSILAWRIPWTEETGGLKSMGFRRKFGISAKTR